MAKFIETGLTGYRECWDLQKRIRAEVLAGADERILLVEHRPVYTLGFHGDEHNLLRLPEGTECIRIERGGDITYHGPGQLVVYPILDLRRRGIGVKQYVHLLERWVTDILEACGVSGAQITDEAPGVWLGMDTGKPRKICALGVKISHGVTMHGYALNVTTDLRGFSAINPCGFTDRGVTSIAAELMRGRELSDKEKAELFSATVELCRRCVPQELI